MKLIFATYTKKQIIAGILRTGLVLFYALLIVGSAWLLKDYSPGYIIKRIIPYDIPPLLSLLTAVFLSLFVLTLEQTRTESILFAAICAVFGILNLDIFLLGIIKNPDIALIISRIDHFFLALVLLGANLHLIYLVCDKKDHWWVVYLGYAVGFVMALLTPTRYYFQGVYTYYWGFFAKKAFLYDLMNFIWLAGIIYGITILAWTYRHTQDLHRKDTIKYLILGFFASVILSLSNTPAMYGYEIYPFGTFIFISLLLLAYGLFKYNLRIALQQLREGIFSTGVLIIITVIGFAPWLILREDQHRFIKIISGLLLVALFYTPVRRIWDAALNLIIKRSSDLLQKEYYALTYRLSGTNHISAIYQEMSGFLFRVFQNSRCAMAFYNTDTKLFEGWSKWNVQHDSGFFATHAHFSEEEKTLTIQPDHLLMQKFFLEEPSLVSRSNIDRWISDTKIAPDEQDWLQQAGIIIPVYSKTKIISLLIVGNKINDRSYSTSEKEIYRNLGIFLGPIIENARILEDLERLVERRTRDLNNALEDANQKSDKISENNIIIRQQNHIFLSLFETGTKIHEIKEFDELFDFTLKQLRALFSDLGFGIILEGERASIFEGGAFVGITDAERDILLKNRTELSLSRIYRIMKNIPGSKPHPEDERDSDNSVTWTILPMRGRENLVIGKMIIKGPTLDPFTEKVISIFLAQVSSAAQNKFLLRRLETIANTDGLTGVSNRAFFDQEYEKAIKNAKQFPDIHFALMIVDINGLKRVNDSFGHVKGDEMIKTVATLLKSICRATDILSRIGGDEFAILLPSINSIDSQNVLNRIRRREKDLDLHCMNKDNEEVRVPVRMSIGVAGSDETEPEKVIKLADERMYINKETFYHQTMDALFTENP